uniref:Proline dehydrogenase domain-containing protein n=1 Tax=viral metagenome TaxID=1070528 RepID=A0A6C0AZ33_9ZZZZ|tara:strand:+ start:16508 stop:17311 length:804 start_codon:yes stop_codon:yes gene_type:complete
MIFRFIGGKNIKNLFNNNIIKKNTIPIINYIAENTSNNSNNIYLEYKNLIKELNSDYIIALKLSSLNFNENYLNKIIDDCKLKNIKLIIDAENNKNIEKYRSIVNNAIINHNSKNLNVIKTYQMYRKDSLHELNHDINYFENNNINLSCKLVRGAYYNEEKNENHLFKSKNDTDLNYNKAIIKCYESRFNNNIIASHNHFSIKLAMLLNKNDKFIIANLKGMNERFMNNIIDIKKAEYIPYGEYNEMIPYLTRRLYENIDQIKYSLL